MICVLCLEYIEIQPDNLSLCSFCNKIGKLILIYNKELIASILENHLIKVKLPFKDHLQYQIMRLNNS